jgi:hypothetical protein
MASKNRQLLNCFVMLMLLYCVITGSISRAAEPAPTQCIKSFMIAVYNARALNQVEQYFCKNQRDSFKTMTVAERNKKLDEFKTYYLGNAKYPGEKINGNTASVEVRGMGYQPSVHKTTSQTETFELVRENSYWRIAGAKLSATFRL